MVASPVLESTADAANESRGRLHNFNGDGDANTGRLVLDTKNGLRRFQVTKATVCGVSYGQSGESIPCRTLDRDKYHNRKTWVEWNLRDGVRKAKYVSVDQS
jgi:hypothetical protein